MANETPQFEDTQPILKPVEVNSEAEGYEAFAKTLGSIAQSTGAKTEDLVSEQSNAMYMASASQMETAKTNAHIDMIKHPDQAENIAANSADTMDSITRNSFVNSQDRRKLKSLGADNFNAIRLKAAEVSYDQSQKAASIAYWDNYPVMMKGIQDALDTNDFKKAKTLEDSFHQASLNAAQVGAITPEQFASVRKSNFDLYDRTQDLLKMAGNPDGHTAAEYHAVAQSPFNTSNFDNVGFPVNPRTQYVTSSYNFDRSMAGQYAALYNDTPINFGVVAQSKDHEYDDFKMQMMGVNQVRGAIHSGMPFNQIDSRVKYLEGQPKLSPSETGEVNYWKSFKNQLAHGDGYLNLMTQTSLGGQYAQEYNQTAVAIKNSGKSDSDKFNAIRDNDNAFIGNMVSLGQSQKLDPNLIRPIPGQYVNEVQSAFAKDAPVAPALARISYIKPEYRAYLADTMAKPNQAMAVYLAGTTFDKADPTFQAQLLEANQDRDYSSLLKTGKDETKNTNIWDDISSNANMKSLYQYLGKLPGGIGTQNGLRSAATNYVLYRAAKEGDVNLNGKAQYEQDFIDNVSKGFNMVEGNRYLFNGESLNLRKPDMDYIADYALSEAYRNIHQGRSEEEFQSYVDLNPLHATNTPDGRIVVIDKAGHAAVDIKGQTAFDKPYTSDMLAYAHKNAEATHEYMHNYFGFTGNLRREAALHPGFPFVVSKQANEQRDNQ